MTGLGAYGFEIAGLDDPRPLLGPAGSDWPLLRIDRPPPDPHRSGRRFPPGTVRVEPDRAEIWITERDRIEVDRATLTVRFATRDRLGDELVVHPYLGLPASIASHWRGRQALHGAAFHHAGRGWALMGDKEAGKSTTLASLLRSGHEVVSDDILVVEAGVLFAGPRCVDLRPEAASVLGGENLGMLGSRVRWRLRPGGVPPSMPLGGVIHLEWGDRPRVEALDSAERLKRLVNSSVIRPDSADGTAFLDLAGLPTWRFVRGHDLGEAERANEELLQTLK